MSLLEILFPRRCFICGGLGSFVCMDCLPRLRSVKTQTCLYCGRPSLWGLTHPVCRKKDGVDGSISLYHYNNPLKKILAGIKYRLVTDALPDLGFIIARRALFLTNVYGDKKDLYLQAVPQTRKRQNQRGFNQTEQMVKILSPLLSLPTTDILIKKKETTPQASLPDHVRRKRNQKNAFLVKNGVPVPEKIVLVDDVVTTGETVKEAARTLKQKGAKKICVLSLAKG